MLRNIFRPFKILFRFLRALRAGVTGLILTAVAAVFLVSPTQNETAALGLSRDIDRPNKSVVLYRASQIVTRYAPDRYFASLARYGDQSLTADDYRLILSRIADGSLRLPDGAEAPQSFISELPDDMSADEIRSALAALHADDTGEYIDFNQFIQDHGRALRPGEDGYDPAVAQATSPTSNGAKFVTARTD